MSAVLAWQMGTQNSSMSSRSRLNRAYKNARIIPFVWPYRKRALWSVAFAGIVAFLWAANFGLTFPLVKVLLENESVQDYVALEINEAQRVIDSSTRYIDTLEDSELVKIARHQRRIGDATIEETCPLEFDS